MTNNINLHHGDCLEVLRGMPDNSVDSIVTDPPYGLAFMGKRWDYDVPSVEVWTECLRVLKPGGHLLAFAGTRTQHRMAVRIEDAGFEIRDMIAWVYGLGFPKSLDVSKAIDKAGGDALAWRAFSEAYAAAVSASDLTHSDIDRFLGIKSSSCYWARTDHRGGMPPRHHWEKVREMLALPAEFSRLYDEAEREVVGQKTSGIANKDEGERHTIGAGSSVMVNITAPATEAARQWSGWGTALKPSLEPVTVARKPLIGTVAENVLAHGTGALNIDGCRVHSHDSQGYAYTVQRMMPGADQNKTGKTHQDGVEFQGQTKDGRWPANLVHDGSEPADMLGDAARFFYCAKASKRDRDEGLEGFEAVHRPNGNKWTDQDYRVARGERPPSAESGPRKNIHPTVKPTDLMAYLVRLVTPPGGTVLDPFMGSGSTGKAATREGFRFVGIEREAQYMDIARARIYGAVPAACDLFSASNKPSREAA